MSHHASLLILGSAVSALAIALSLQALLSLARSAKGNSAPVSQAKRRSLWARMLNCPILILIVLPPAVTSDWRWQMGCSLTGAILWLIMVLVLLRMRVTGADKGGATVRSI
jgi:hypothetical protein